MKRRAFIKSSVAAGLSGVSSFFVNESANASCVESKELRSSPFLELSLMNQLYADLDSLIATYNLAGGNTEDPLVEAKLNMLNAVLISPSTMVEFPIWEDFLSANPATRYFLFLAGDYQGWQSRFIQLSTSDHVLRIQDISGSSPQIRKVLTYFAWDGTYKYHPVNRPLASEQALIPELAFGGNSAEGWRFAKNWIATGLSSRGPRHDATRANGWRIRAGCHILIDKCLIENVLKGVELRSSHCTVQRCVIRNGAEPSVSDNQGVIISPNQGAPIVDVKVLDNEIYNMIDAFAVNESSFTSSQGIMPLCDGTPSPADPIPRLDPTVLPRDDPNRHKLAWVSVSGVIVDGNDMYNEPEFRDERQTENIVDLKAGADDGLIRNRFSNNRLWGLRNGHGGSTEGEGPESGELLGSIWRMVEIQRGARNWLISSNVIEDGVTGLHESVWHVLDNPNDDDTNWVYHRSRNTVMRGNIFANLCYAVHPRMSAQIISGRFWGLNFLFEFSDNGEPVNRPSVFSQNFGGNYGRIKAFKTPTDPVPYTGDPGLTMTPTPSCYRFRYERRRWTGSEWNQIDRLDPQLATLCESYENNHP